jgi:hypothetical protein
MKYIRMEDSEYLQNHSDYHNISQLKFESYWRFRVTVSPSIDGFAYFKITVINIEKANNTVE